MPSPRTRRSALSVPELSVRNDRLTDREMLANINAVADADGWSTTTEIALKCGFTGDARKGQTPAVKVASRLSWMRDGGLLESTDPDLRARSGEPGAKDKRWRPSPIGLVILEGALSRTVENAISKMDPGAQVLMMRKLTQYGYINAERSVAFALRREYQHNVAQRKINFRLGTG